MLLCEYMEILDQVLLLLYLFVKLIRNKCENIINWLENLKSYVAT
jgi:flagellar biogenesis protein FliO